MSKQFHTIHRTFTELVAQVEALLKDEEAQTCAACETACPDICLGQCNDEACVAFSIIAMCHMYLSKLFAVLHTCDFLFAWIWLECRSVQESKPSAREGVGLKFKDPQADLTIRSSPVKSAGFDLKVQNVHQNATSIDVCDTYYTYAFGNKKLRMRFLMLFAVISTAFLSSAGQATGSRARGQERRSEERGS